MILCKLTKSLQFCLNNLLVDLSSFEIENWINNSLATVIEIKPC